MFLAVPAHSKTTKPTSSASSLRRVLPIATTLAVERINVGSTSGLSLNIDPMSGTIEVRGKNALRIVAKYEQAKSHLCPHAEVTKTGVLLRCETRAIDAAFTQLPGKASGPAYLTLIQLRGLPWRDNNDQVPFFFYDPVQYHLGSACPGDTPESRAECSLVAGRFAEAEVLLKQSLKGEHQAYSALRLGDLKAAAGEVETAAMYYRIPEGSYPFGLLAQARYCELTGNCLHRGSAGELFNGNTFDEPIGTELDLRWARAQVYSGHVQDAIVSLVKRMSSNKRPPLCASAEELCRRLALAGLESAENKSDQANALAFYLALPSREHGPLADRMAHAAAEIAVKMGARVFAANILAATVYECPPLELEAHLLRATELYVESDDPIRAGVIFEFARTWIGKKRHATERWAALGSLIDRNSARLDGSDPAANPALEVASELHAAEAGVEHARKLAVPAGDQPATAAYSRNGETK